jgi:hypothetical protein
MKYRANLAYLLALLAMLTTQSALAYDSSFIEKYKGDLNTDNVVDFNDLLIFSNQWLQAPGDPNADIAPGSGDGFVNFLDFAVLANDWQQNSFGYSAFDVAWSGSEILNYWLNGITIHDTNNTSNKLSAVTEKLQQKLLTAGIIAISPSYEAVSNTINIPDVLLDSATGQAFSAVIRAVNANTLEAKITGSAGSARKEISVNYNFVTLDSGVFDFALVTKGPLSLSGLADIGSTDLSIYASVYIEGYGVSGNDLTMASRTIIAGDVFIANPYATYSVSGSVGGAYGSDVNDHIHIGVPEIAFPTPDPEHFRQYATGPEILSGTKPSHAVFNNCSIKAGSSVTFADDTTINGILYIESPATVTFAGKVTVNGIIAGDGELTDYDGTSYLNFSGQVIHNDTSKLIGSQFDQIKKETGTFLCAPGFEINFSGLYVTINGAVAGSGFSFSGQFGGIVNGTIIDYSRDTMTMVGQPSLIFNRSGRHGNPAGFVSDQAIFSTPASYDLGMKLSTSEFLIEQIRQAVMSTPYPILGTLNNTVFSPPHDSAGNILNEYPGYSQKIAVQNENAFGPGSDFYRIKVEIYFNDELIRTAIWLRANY